MAAMLPSEIPVTVNYRTQKRKFYRNTITTEYRSIEVLVALDSIISYTVNFTNSTNVDVPVCTKITITLHMRRGCGHTFEFDMSNINDQRSAKHLIDLLKENFEII